MATDAKTTLALTVLALIVPAGSIVPEIREQPADTRRTDIARVEWIGAPAAEVSVEYRHGLQWITQASGLPVQDEGDDVSSARWQPGRQSPSGTYRMRIEAPGDTLVSEDFAVSPCDCVIPGPVHSRWDDGRFRLRVRAEYIPAGTREFRLPAAPVRTGRPVIRVLRYGRRVGSVRLSYTRGAFRGIWAVPRKPQDEVVFRLVSLTDRFGNR